MEEMQAGARIAPGEQQAQSHGFRPVESRPSPANRAWESPWGPGRPGWHIECSAMSWTLLGDTFDIHGGGKDLIFPHHENEIAQSEAATGKPFVNYWLHNGFVNVNQEKMSKSLGNFFTIRDILKSYDPEVVRFFILTAHYRSPIDFSDQNLKDAKAGLSRFYEALQAAAEATEGCPGAEGGGSEEATALEERFPRSHGRRLQYRPGHRPPLRRGADHEPADRREEIPQDIPKRSPPSGTFTRAFSPSAACSDSSAPIPPPGWRNRSSRPWPHSTSPPRRSRS